MKNFISKNKIIVVILIEIIVYCLIAWLTSSIFTNDSLVAGISAVITYTMYDMCAKGSNKNTNMDETEIGK